MPRRLGLLLAAALVAGCGANPMPAPQQAIVGVSVTDGESGQPRAGIDIVFSDSAGALLARVQTDALGSAHITAGPGSATSVTVVARNSAKPQYPVIQTVAGAEPGDTVPFRVYGSQTDRVLGTLDVILPPAPKGAEVFVTDNPCGNGVYTSTHFTIKVTDRCTHPGTNVVDLAFIALDKHQDPIAYVVQTDIALTAGADTAVDFPSNWRIDFAQTEVRYSNAPADGHIQVTRCLERGGLTRVCSVASFLAQGSSGAWLFQYPKDLATGLTLEVFQGNPPRDWRSLTRRFATLPTDFPVDFSQMLPALTAGTLASVGARPSVSWGAAGDLSAAAYGEFLVDWDGAGSWGVVFPPDAISPVQVPQLPADLAALAPAPDAKLRLFYLRFVAQSTLGSYRDARNTLRSVFPKEYTMKETTRLAPLF